MEPTVSNRRPSLSLMVLLTALFVTYPWLHRSDCLRASGHHDNLQRGLVAKRKRPTSPTDASPQRFPFTPSLLKPWLSFVLPSFWQPITCCSLCVAKWVWRRYRVNTGYRAKVYRITVENHFSEQSLEWRQDIWLSITARSDGARVASVQHTAVKVKRLS